MTVTLDTGGIATLNPFRYKGYYYDSESGMYYCNARYYIPEWGRWLTPDSPDYLQFDQITGFNNFAYCGNNPVMYYDPSGHAFISILIGLGIAALIGAAVGASSYVVGEVANYAITGDFAWSWGGFLGSILGGAVGGMLAYVIPGSASIGSFFSGVATTAGTMIGQNISDNTGYSAEDILLSSIFSGVFASLSVAIMSKIRIQGLNAGRSSYSAISRQIYTKFKKQTIRRITTKTFGKMLAIEAYNGVASYLFENVYDFLEIDDWVSAWF